MKPVMVGSPENQRPRIGFVARKNIKKGEELFYHYGVDLPQDEFPWIRTDARTDSVSISVNCMLCSVKMLSLLCVLNYI